MQPCGRGQRKQSREGQQDTRTQCARTICTRSQTSRSKRQAQEQTRTAAADHQTAHRPAGADKERRSGRTAGSDRRYSPRENTRFCPFAVFSPKSQQWAGGRKALRRLRLRRVQLVHVRSDQVHPRPRAATVCGGVGADHQAGDAIPWRPGRGGGFHFCRGYRFLCQVVVHPNH